MAKAPVPDHAYTLVEDRGEGNAGPITYRWRCTCGSEGKPGDDPGPAYDSWIKHQQRTYEAPADAVAEAEPDAEPEPVAEPEPKPRARKATAKTTKATKTTRKKSG